METGFRFIVCTWCPTYNHSEYIVDTMDGFCKQDTCFPVVYTIADDASSDGTPIVIKNYLTDNFIINTPDSYKKEETEDYIHIFARHKNNCNCFFAVYLLKYNHYSIKKSRQEYRNQWAEKSKYAAICEGDDYWIDNMKLQKQVELMEMDPTISIVHTDCNMLNQNSGVVVPTCNAPFVEYYNNIDVKQTIENILLAKCKVRTPTVLYRSESYKAFVQQNEFAYNGGYFPMTDIQLWIGLLLQGKGAYISEATAMYRVSNGTASRPKKYYSNIRFQLSSKELRIYYNQKYGYLQNEISDIIKDYKHLLRIYREHDSSFKGILEVDKLYNCKLEHYLFKIKNAWWHVRYDLHRVKTYLKNVDDKLNL